MRLSSRRLRATGGTPIEEAPLWALVLLVGVVWLVAFPALVGLVNGLRPATGGGAGLAAAALALSLLVVAGLARQPRWRRAPSGELDDTRPPFVRFSTWLWTTLLVPNVLYGAIVLMRGGEGLSYSGAWALGLLVAAIQGAFCLADRLRRQRRA